MADTIRMHKEEHDASRADERACITSLKFVPVFAWLARKNDGVVLNVWALSCPLWVFSTKASSSLCDSAGTEIAGVVLWFFLWLPSEPLRSSVV